MYFLNQLFSKPPYPREMKLEVDRLINELIQIGSHDDFLSERPGRGFNNQCRHIRAREIGKRLHEIGGITLMEYSQNRVRRKLGKNLCSHLEYAWAEIGRWLP